MIIKEEFLSRLRKIFDLNLYEAKVWTALLSRGVSTAGELSNISDVPRSRTYDILESLEKKGFVVMRLGKPIKFVALKPEEVVERVKRNLMVDAHNKTKRLEQLKSDDVLSELNSLYTNGVKFIERPEMEMIEISDPAFNVLAYFSNPLVQRTPSSCHSSHKRPPTRREYLLPFLLQTNSGVCPLSIVNPRLINIKLLFNRLI